MPENFTEAEVRVLGSLVEKQITTPEYYPLTLNALTAACNQKSNRDPVVSYDETIILGAVDSLRERNLLYLHYGSTSRTVKYKHMLPSVYELAEAETAIIGVLILRGPQTLGEIRERSGRLFEFTSISEVAEKLDELAGRDEPLVIKLARRPGQKDARYAHLLSGPIDETHASFERAESAASKPDDRISQLQEEVTVMRGEVDRLKSDFADFRKQFE